MSGSATRCTLTRLRTSRTTSRHTVMQHGMTRLVPVPLTPGTVGALAQPDVQKICWPPRTHGCARHCCNAELRYLRADMSSRPTWWRQSWLTCCTQHSRRALQHCCPRCSTVARAARAQQNQAFALSNMQIAGSAVVNGPGGAACTPEAVLDTCQFGHCSQPWRRRRPSGRCAGGCAAIP